MYAKSLRVRSLLWIVQSIQWLGYELYDLWNRDSISC